MHYKSCMRQEKGSGNMHTVHKGKLINLRTMQEDDAEILQKWYMDKDFRRSYDAYTSVSLESIAKDIQESSSIDSPTADKVYFMVTSKKDDKPIGVGCIRSINRQNGNAEIVLGIGEKKNRLAGYGIDLMISLLDIIFYNLNFEKAYLKVLNNNALGLKSALSFGFKEEGALRKDKFINGEYEDLIILGILKDEYEKLKFLPRWKARKN